MTIDWDDRPALATAPVWPGRRRFNWRLAIAMALNVVLWIASYQFVKFAF